MRKIVAVMALALGAAAAGPGCAKGRKSAARTCVDAAGAACQACRDNAKAQFCGASYIAPQASGEITVNGQKGCCGFDDPKLRASCEEILRCLRTTGCSGGGNNPSRCLCGSTDFVTCGKGGPTTGECVAVYKKALEGGPPGTVLKLFGDPKSPIGVANNTFTCDVDANCPCGQKQGKDAGLLGKDAAE